jgi:hypothetical protein
MQVVKLNNVLHYTRSSQLKLELSRRRATHFGHALPRANEDETRWSKCPSPEQSIHHLDEGLLA